MDPIDAGDADPANAEVFSMGDNALLANLMEKISPTVEQLSIKAASEVTHDLVSSCYNLDSAGNFYFSIHIIMCYLMLCCN